MTPLPRPCDNKMLCERCQRFDIQAFGRDPYPYRWVSLSSIISSNHCSFCSLLLESLRRVQGCPTVRYGKWVNFTVTKATKQPVAGARGLNVVSIDAFVGSIDALVGSIDTFVGIINVDGSKRRRYVKFHVAADPGEMPLFSVPDPGY